MNVRLKSGTSAPTIMSYLVLESVSAHQALSERLMFTARKVAQMAAFFARKEGGITSTVKLTKLLYLADRESLAEYGFPISYDYGVSMPHGPALTLTLDLTQGEGGRSSQAMWDEWIADRDNHNVSVQRKFSRADLDELSDADIEILERTWSEFGWMDKWELVDYTHEHLSEYQDPNGSSLPISDEARLFAITGNPVEAKVLAEEIEAVRQCGRMTSS